ncbi:MAG: preprotein translocase subunit YajC [Pseudomonadota bacterium]
MDFASSMLFLQAAGGGFEFIFLMLGMLIIFFFIVERPRQRRMKAHQEMLNNVKRGDTVVTAGGIVGKVTKVYEEKGEVKIEIAENVRITVMRATLADVRGKNEPVPANDTKAS